MKKLLNILIAVCMAVTCLGAVPVWADENSSNNFKSLSVYVTDGYNPIEGCLLYTSPTTVKADVSKSIFSHFRAQTSPMRSPVYNDSKIPISSWAVSAPSSRRCSPLDKIRTLLLSFFGSLTLLQIFVIYPLSSADDNADFNMLKIVLAVAGETSRLFTKF